MMFDRKPPDSHKVEIMDAYTMKRLAQVDVSNCRFIAFDGH